MLISKVVVDVAIQVAEEDRDARAAAGKHMEVVVDLAAVEDLAVDEQKEPEAVAADTNKHVVAADRAAPAVVEDPVEEDDEDEDDDDDDAFP